MSKPQFAAALTLACLTAQSATAQNAADLPPTEARSQPPVAAPSVPTPAAPLAAPANLAPLPSTPRVDAPAPAPAAKSPTTVPTFMGRGLGANTTLRIDDTIAFFDDGGGRGFSNVTLVSAALKLSPNVGISLKTGYTHDTFADGTSGGAILNGVAGVLYAFRFPNGLRVVPSFGFSIPWGQGAGDSPDKLTKAALRAAGQNRVVLEGSTTGVNFIALNPGVTVGWVGARTTVQLDLQFIESLRVRATEAAEKDAAKTNTWTTLLLGWFLVPDRLSVSGELHYQRYLSDVAAVAKDPAARDAFSATLGARGYLDTSLGVLRPGLAWTRPIHGQPANAHEDVMQFDLSLAFK